MADKEDSVRVCQALRSVVEEYGWTQEKLAMALGVRQGSVGRWVTNVEPKASMIVQIERTMGVPIGTVLARAGLGIKRTQDIRELLRTDQKLVPLLQALAVQHYDAWVKLSSKERVNGTG